ncbi:MAG: PQQ-binding-like beta-propeller repeat protein [Terriglobales bacterium]|jgi:outer membrane protein assembly factor BamB
MKIKNLNTLALRSLTILCALAIASIGHAPMAAAQENWVQTYYNGAHTGYNPDEKTLGVGNVSSLQLLWADSVAGGVTNFAVDGGVVYATGQSNNLVALNASTGAQLWSVNNGGNGGENGDGAIATGGGLVFAHCYFPDTGGSAYGAICAYRAKTGKMVWQYSNPCNCLPEADVESPLVFANGVVYFGYSTGGGGQTHGIYAVKAATGKLLWGYGAYNNSLNIGAAAVGGSDVYLDYGNPPVIPAEIVALTTSNGTLTWTAPISTVNAEVSVSDGVVYASSEWTGTDATLYALKATTGATLWSYTYGTESWCGGAEAPSPPAIAKGVVYFQGVDGNLYALKAKNGSLIWVDSPNESLCDQFRSSPSIANGVVYISGGDDADFASNTTAYNAATGALLWGSPSPHGTLYTPPVVVNGILYFASPGDAICESICAYSLP